MTRNDRDAGPSERGPGMPGTRHEPATAAPAQVKILSGWRDLRTLEPAIETLQRAAGTPVTARFSWWRAALAAERGAVPVGLTLARGSRRRRDGSGHGMGQQAVRETIEFEREPARLAALRDEIEAVHRARDHDAGRVSDLDGTAGVVFWRSVYDVHAARGELEVATLRLDGHLAAYVIALVDSPAYRVFDGRFAPAWRPCPPGRRLEAAVVDHARRTPFGSLDLMSSIAPGKLVASTCAQPRWTVTAAAEAPPSFTAASPPSFTAAGGSVLTMTAAVPCTR